MSRRTRLFLIVSASILALGLGTGLLASYMGGLQTLTILGSDGPAELDYVPSDAGLVAYANLREVMDSHARRRLLEMRPGARDDNARELEERTGIDVERDVDLVVVSVSHGAGDGTLVLARGRFDEVRIEGFMRARGGEAGEYRGIRLVTAPGRAGAAGDDAGRRFALAFVEPGLVACGAPVVVRRSIDARTDGPTVRGNGEIMRLVREMAGGNAWAVGRFDAVASGSGLPQGMADRLPQIAWFAATGRIDSGVQGVIRAETGSEEAARDLREVVRGFVALARLQTQHAELASVVDSLELGGEGTTVSVAFSVSPDVIDALSRMQRGRPDPPPVPAF